MRYVCHYPTGALPLRPRDLTPCARIAIFTGRLTPPRPFRPLSRRSGRIPASPYPPLRYFQSGPTVTSPSTFFQRTAITPLTSCLTSGVHFIGKRSPPDFPTSHHPPPTSC